MDAVARRLVETLGGLEAGPILDGQAVRMLATLSPASAVAGLSSLLSLDAPPPHVRRVLLGLCRALRPESPLPAATRASLHRAAAANHHRAVVALFSTAAPVMPPGAANQGEARVLRAPDGETLGHRSQRARVERSRDKLLRLCFDDEPQVVRNVLLNPRLTEAAVVRIASRRPVPAAVLEEVARSTRWSGRASVRRALVANPFTPPPLATGLLHPMLTSELRTVAANPVIHPVVRDGARALMAARAHAS